MGIGSTSKYTIGYCKLDDVRDKKKSYFCACLCFVYNQGGIVWDSAAISRELMVGNTASNLIFDGIYATFGR